MLDSGQAWTSTLGLTTPLLSQACHSSQLTYLVVEPPSPMSGRTPPVGALQSQYHVLPRTVVPRGWLHEDLLVFIQITIEVGAVEVKCLNVPVVLCCECENGPETCKFCYQ